MLAASRSKNLKVVGTIGLILFTTLVYAEEHTHKPGERGVEYALKSGEKWGTDLALRQGMDNIRQAVTASQDGIEKERFSAQDYQRLAEVVDKNVSTIVKNCKLTEDADKAFHIVVLADLTGGAQLMRTSPKIQAKRVGALGVLQSLRNYGEYFQHPGWSLGVTNVP